MKFAFIIFKYFPFGGAQRDMMRIARECAKRGHQVEIYTLSWDGPLPEAGISRHLVRARGWLNHQRYRDFIEQVRARVAVGGFDLVVGFNRMPGLDAYFAADPCFVERVRASGKRLQTLFARYRFFAACERAVFAPDARCEILLLSAREQALFQQHYATPGARFHLIPPPLAGARFAGIEPDAARREVRAEFGFEPDDLVLLLVGSGFRTKGLDRAILGLAALPPDLLARTRLLAAGQDNAAPFERLAGKLGLRDRVHICGGRDDIPRLMHAADLLVHPARSELAGHVLIEAMACGLPLLASEVCGYAHHVAAAEAGELLADPYSQTQFNARLAAMLQSGERERWRQNGRRYAAKLQQTNDGSAEAVLLEQFAQARVGLA